MDTQGFELVPCDVVAEAKVVAFAEAFLTAWCISGGTLCVCVCVCVFVCGCLCIAGSDVAGVCDKFSKSQCPSIFTLKIRSSPCMLTFEHVYYSWPRTWCSFRSLVFLVCSFRSPKGASPPDKVYAGVHKGSQKSKPWRICTVYSTCVGFFGFFI